MGAQHCTGLHIGTGAELMCICVVFYCIVGEIYFGLQVVYCMILNISCAGQFCTLFHNLLFICTEVYNTYRVLYNVLNTAPAVHVWYCIMYWTLYLLYSPGMLSLLGSAPGQTSTNEQSFCTPMYCTFYTGLVCCLCWALHLARPAPTAGTSGGTPPSCWLYRGAR